MSESDKIFIEVSKDSGKKYGYPQCCIDQFCSQPPSYFETHNATKDDRRRYQAGQLNGVFTGFVPCTNHANEIIAGKIKLVDLITKERSVPFPFPHDWTQQ